MTRAVPLLSLANPLDERAIDLAAVASKIAKTHADQGEASRLCVPKTQIRT
jgi:hypothetical protein